MHLTRFTDYSLRVLLYLALRPTQRSSIDELTQFYSISKDHLVKVVHNLGRLGYIQTIRGRNGGVELAKPPGAINIGDVVRKTEPNFDLVECFEPQKNQCVVTDACQLKFILAEALESFLNVLDQYTLESLVTEKKLAKMLLQIGD